MISFRKLFICLFFPLAALLAGGAMVYGHLEVERELAYRRELELAQVRLGVGAATWNIEPVAGDLLFLSRLRSLREVVHEPSAARLASLAADFSAFSGAKQVYDQIRWLDESGMERVRVDLRQGLPVTVPAAELQNKAQRYYFREALRLGVGEVFISPLDLNIEHERIEIPYKPMLRVATRVVDGDGRRRGVLVLNYYGNGILQAFAKATGGRGMLVDRQGYWLKSPRAADEWGFMFKRAEASMGVRAPAAWKAIVAAERGQTELQDGVWTWETMRPLGSAESRRAGTPPAGDYFWKVVSHWPGEQRDAIAQRIRLRVASAAGLMLVLAGLGSWKLARAWTLLAESETKYQTISKFAYDWETWISPNRQPLFSSPSCERVTGRPAADFMADPDFLRNIAHPDDRAIVDEHLLHHIDRHETCEFCFRILLPDGQVRWIEHICLPVFSESGEFLGRRASNRDITDHKNDEARIQQLAFFDVLTGLPNRRMLSDRLDHGLAQARRFGRSLAVMFLDLDHFKQINDTLGHDAGDELLKHVANRLQACVRSGDTIARQGGDEFIVVLTEVTHAEDAARVADKIIQAIGEPIRISGTPLHVSTSIGIAVYPINGSDDAQELLKKADRAMYAAKAAGRNTYRFFAD